jgi:hypothetical protein
MNERLICRNGENTLDTTGDWDLVALDAAGDGGTGDGGGAEGDDGDWELESLEHEGEANDAR